MLVESHWQKRDSPFSANPDFISFFPQKQCAVSCNFVCGPNQNQYLVWACWIHVDGKQVVYTALKKSSEWRRESYQIKSNILKWTVPDGLTIEYSRVKGGIPIELSKRAARAIERLESRGFPEKSWCE